MYNVICNVNVNVCNCKCKTECKGKGMPKIWGLGDVMHVFRTVYIKNAKMALQHFLNGPNQTEFENKEIQIPQVTATKVTTFDFQILEVGHFCKIST